MSLQPAWCPRCRKDVSFVTTGQRRSCSECGFEFDVEPATTTPPSFRSYLRGWMLFLVCMFLPAGLTWLVAVLRPAVGSGTGVTAVGVAVVGSILAGSIGGIWIGQKVASSPTMRILLGLLLMLPLGVACFALCFLGCAVGGGGRM